jgi:hypothetical protein
MSVSKMTPGEWVICPTSDDRPYIRAGGPDGPLIAKTYRESITHGALPGYANARAIAAVPKLVKALEDLLGHWDAFTEQGTTFGNQERAYYCLAKGAQDTWKQAREALAAATTPEED